MLTEQKKWLHLVTKHLPWMLVENNAITYKFFLLLLFRSMEKVFDQIPTNMPVGTQVLWKKIQANCMQEFIRVYQC